MLSDSKRVGFNGESLSCSSVQAGVPQDSILVLLLFLIYINNLPDNLESPVKLLGDDNSLFSCFHYSLICSWLMNDDLRKILDWACKWKLLLNLDVVRQAQAIVLYVKLWKVFNQLQRWVKKIWVIRRLNNIIPRQLLFTIHKSWLWCSRVWSWLL